MGTFDASANRRRAVVDKRSARHYSRSTTEEGAGGTRRDATRDGDFGGRPPPRDDEGARRDWRMADRSGGRLHFSIARRSGGGGSLDPPGGALRGGAPTNQKVMEES